MAVSRIGDFVGRVLDDRYRLLAPLGTGGSAHVFLAEDVKLRRRVAVKVLHAALADAAWPEPTGAVIGTARYASPEQARGGSVDGKADVYALALTLVEAVTGRVPFAADTTIATLMGRTESQLYGPPELGPLAEVIT